MKLRRIAAIAAAGVLAAAMSLPAAAFAGDFKSAEEEVHVYRIAGDTAEETSAFIGVEVARMQGGYSDDDQPQCTWAIIARNDDFADAMSSVGLAGALRCPILLTDRYELSDITAEALMYLGVKNVYIIGGTGAVKQQVETDITSLGINVEKRLWGDYSWDTSLACAKEIDKWVPDRDPIAIGAMSINFQDALSISSYAYSHCVPIILQTDGATAADRGFTPEGYNYLYDLDYVYIVGGYGAISEESTMGLPLDDESRIWGEDGYDTSYAIALYFYSAEEAYPNWTPPPDVVVACGAQQARGVDALAGAALAGTLHCPILLVSGNSAMEPVNYVTIDTYIADPLNWPYLYNGYVLGGTYVIPQDTYNHVLDLLANG